MGSSHQAGAWAVKRCRGLQAAFSCMVASSLCHTCLKVRKAKRTKDAQEKVDLLEQ